MDYAAYVNGTFRTLAAIARKSGVPKSVLANIATGIKPVPALDAKTIGKIKTACAAIKHGPPGKNSRNDSYAKGRTAAVNDILRNLGV